MCAKKKQREEDGTKEDGTQTAGAPVGGDMEGGEGVGCGAGRRAACDVT